MIRQGYLAAHLRTILLASVAILAQAACDEPQFPSSTPTERPRVDAGTPRRLLDGSWQTRRTAWLEQKLAPCRVVIDSMRELSGETALDCSGGRTAREALACAKRAFDGKRPFLLCESGWGMDSYLETAVAGLPDGNVAIYYLDTFGPRYRGTCLRPNVSFATGEWPQCRTALLRPVDLETGRPRADRTRLAGEEPWPVSCAGMAARATDQATVRLIAAGNPLPEAARWGPQCRRASVSFELLIDETGTVRCARIIDAGPGFAYPPLYDSVRARLLRWRFTPPTIGGTPVNLRWGMTIRSLRKDEAVPGLPIYPICP